MTVSATEANRSFSKLLRRVRAGERVAITSRGETVAVIAPPGRDEEADLERRARALEELRRHWATLTSVTVGPWTREELYDRE